ncbi:MAG: esterase family protein [Acidobacteria bacterium]|nr:esterase family protein [Acidobacteriota bacterium]
MVRILHPLLLAGIVLPVLPAQPPQWITPPITGPGLEQRTFESTAAKARISYFVSLPETYSRDTRVRFPVLYWLHGTGGGGAGVAFLSSWFRDAALEGRIPAMIVVFPNGLRSSMWCDSKDGSVPMETIVIKELIPHVDASLRTVASRNGRILEGFSMGGYGAARLGFRNAELFAAISILAAGPLDLEFRGPRTRANPAERDSILKQVYGGDMEYFRAMSPITLAEQCAASVRGKLLIRLAAGTRDSTFQLNRLFHEHLDRLKVTHSFAAPEGVAHDPRALLAALGDGNWEFYRAALRK